MLIIRDIRMELNDSFESIKNKVISKYRLQNVTLFEYAKKSVDARNKNDVFFVASFYVECKNESKVKNKKISVFDKRKYRPTLNKEKYDYDKKVVVVGAGPCGLFAALNLVLKGFKVILIEQGKMIKERIKDVENLLNSGVLNPFSNIQFGEGGAGTFSDGKLQTTINDEHILYMIEEFINNGANDDLRYLSKPHIGTDALRKVIVNIRNKIISLGGEVLFEHKLVDLDIIDNSIKGIKVLHNDEIKYIETNNVFLAIGHSARDTFKLLKDLDVPLEQKPFSMGVRIEHLQENINKAQYGEKFYKHPALKAADYKLSVHLDNGRGVYTFCMCPGGEVVASSSEEGGVVVNGMSNYARDGKYSNSAVLVNILTSDFESDDVLAGVELQRKYEKKAYEMSNNYYAVAQTVGDFLNDSSTTYLKNGTSYKPNVVFGNIKDVVPSYVYESLKEALPLLDKKLKGFADNDSLLLGVETRSSSPVRIVRNKNYESIKIKGLYPLGEGAGYAGGITTSAVDGMKAVEAFIENNKFKKV